MEFSHPSPGLASRLSRESDPQRCRILWYQQARQGPPHSLTGRASQVSKGSAGSDDCAATMDHPVGESKMDGPAFLAILRQVFLFPFLFLHLLRKVILALAYLEEMLETPAS